MIGYVNPYYKTLFQGLNKRHGKRSMFFIFALSARTSIFAAVCVFLEHKSFTQILVLQFVCIFVIYSLWTKNPVPDGDVRSMFYLNEVTIFLAVSSLVAFTNLGPSLKIREYISYYFILTFVCVILANLLVMFNKMGFSCIRYIRRVEHLDHLREVNKVAMVKVKTKKAESKKGLKI